MHCVSRSLSGCVCISHTGQHPGLWRQLAFNSAHKLFSRHSKSILFNQVLMFLPGLKIKVVESQSKRQMSQAGSPLPLSSQRVINILRDLNVSPRSSDRLKSSVFVCFDVHQGVSTVYWTSQAAGCAFLTCK